MRDFVRVKDKATGAEYSVRIPDPERHEVLEGKEATDANGRALPAKPKTSVRTKATASNTQGDEPADTPKEGSA